MAGETFQKGDTVRLKSGGPKMTVTNVGESMMHAGVVVFCVWFDGSKKFDDVFPPETLEKV